ncbi:uncharacterized protein LOC114339075 [Diabrotica virgifera virgifera]|uniref:Uncharacterized protein LOC114339075 n=1 Tax=Diabrotica virgifera virgifera TaxID=50390 RepID=A0A6P7G8L6_DIAVI|nr:uncharacterized protein LOC114339075 [Diabrotica virgifera virgifera]
MTMIKNIILGVVVFACVNYVSAKGEDDAKVDDEIEHTEIEPEEITLPSISHVWELINIFVLPVILKFIEEFGKIIDTRKLFEMLTPAVMNLMTVMDISVIQNILSVIGKSNIKNFTSQKTEL